jgi:hypothetical protein
VLERRGEQDGAAGVPAAHTPAPGGATTEARPPSPASAPSPTALGTLDPGAGSPSRSTDGDGAGAGHEDPAPPAVAVDRSVAIMATDGVAYLLYWLVILVLLSQSVALVLQPPQGQTAVGAVAGFACLVWAGLCLGIGLLRGTTPQGTDLPPAGWLPVLAAGGCLITLVLIRSAAGMVGPWGVELVVAGLLVAGVTIWAGPAVGAVLGILLGLLALVAPLVSEGEQAPLGTPLSRAVAGVVLIGLGFAVALALEWTRRSSQRLQGLLDARQDALIRERAQRAAAGMAAELERSLHDTALNTLETIAAHGEHLDPAAVVARCRSDVQRLSEWRSESGFVGIAEVLDRLVAHADRLGLVLDIEVLGGGSATAPAGWPDEPADAPPSPTAVVPPPVLQAFAGAATEALTNVQKHAGVDRASIIVALGPGGLQVLVADAGRGMARAAPGGYGVVSSVQGRMAQVGGTAVVSPGPQGVGTAVLLSWQPPPEPPSSIGEDLLVRMAGVAVVVGAVMAGFSVALVVLGWSTYAHPLLALAPPLVAVGLAGWLVDRARDGGRIAARHLALVAVVYVVLGALTLITDPSCSTLLGQGVVLDVRVPLVAALLLLAPRAATVLTILGAMGVSAVLGAVVWVQQGLGCGPAVSGSGVYVLAGLIAIWLFAKRLGRVGAQYDAARAQAAQAEVRIRTQQTVRAEEELWVADTLASAQQLLGAIAEGRMPPATPATREACRAEAGFLRALLAVGRAPERLRRPARIWLRLLHAADCRVTVRGSLATCRPPMRTIGQVGGVLDTAAALAPGCSVTISAWDEPGRGTLTVILAGPRVAHAGEALESRVHRVAGEAWRDFGGDIITVEWTWLRPPEQPAPPKPLVAAR